jgi:hypothetical protein
MNPTIPKALYLYCLTRCGQVEAGSLVGVDDHHPVFTRDYGDITTVISQVILAEFVGPAAEEHMRDAAWITPRACRHQEVIAQISRHTDLFPAHFGTIFSTDDVLAGLIDRHHEQILGFLDSVQGHAEWSLKGFLDRSRAVTRVSADALSAEDRRLVGLSAGLRYFEEKKIRAAAGRQLNHWLNNTLNEVMGDLSTVASRHCLRELLSRKATGAGTDMVVNGAFLVAQDGLEAFHKKVDDLNQTHAQAGLSFELSGPWPPYSFCPALQDNEGGNSHGVE